MTPDLPNAFWSGWITIITVLSLLALAWLVYSIYFSSDASEEHESPVWDGNLREGSNPAPIWWFWLILALMVFSVVYLMLYPGLGSFAGFRKWSQGGRLADSYAEYEKEFSAGRSALLSASHAELKANPEAMRAARNLFNRYCIGCHGPGGRGQANRFPNLSDGAWQWGGSPAQLTETIRNGRQAVMAPWQDVLGDEGVRQVAQYVQSMAGIPGDTHPGKQQYLATCVACHGASGEGNPALGAPNLADDYWLYGNSLSAIGTSIAQGRQGVMPAFGHRLDEVQLKLLVAWLSEPE